MTANFLAPILTPRGHLLFAPEADALLLTEALQARLIAAGAHGAGHALLQLGAGEVGVALPAALGYWRDFGARYVTALCAAPEFTENADAIGVSRVPPPPPDELATLAADAPPMAGVEYLTATVLRALWEDLDAALRIELVEAK